MIDIINRIIVLGIVLCLLILILTFGEVEE
jgi:hypothetical protein